MVVIHRNFDWEVGSLVIAGVDRQVSSLVDNWVDNWVSNLVDNQVTGKKVGKKAIGMAIF